MSNVSEATMSPELRLLQMMIENDHLQAEADKALRNSARDAQREAMEDELEAIEDQASAIRTGALVQGSLTMASGAAAVITTLDAASSSEASAVTDEAAQACQNQEPETWLSLLAIGGDTAGALAEPAGNLFGRAPETDAKRDAEKAQQEQQQASWIAEDAEDHRQKVERESQALLQQMQSILETQHQATMAVVSNV